MEKKPASLQLREKLITYGANALCDVELLAVCISSGTHRKSCLTLASDLLRAQGNLRAVLNSNFIDFKKINGLGMTRYAQLQAAREICRRSDYITLQKETKITSSQQAFTFLKRQLRDQRNELFAAIFLDSQNHVIAFNVLFHGTINAASVYVRPIIDRALQLNATTIIAAHNHPSGNCQPSKADYNVTKKIKTALAIFDIDLLDHVVVGDNKVYSIILNQQWSCV